MSNLDTRARNVDLGSTDFPWKWFLGDLEVCYTLRNFGSKFRPPQAFLDRQNIFGDSAFILLFLVGNISEVKNYTEQFTCIHTAGCLRMIC